MTVPALRALRCLPWLLLPLLPACAPTGSPEQSSAQAGHTAGEHLQWRGERACADCEGIRTDLKLTRQDGGGDYTLTETFLARDGNARFVETGHWQRDTGELRLQGDQGTRHAYLLLPDGGLQPGDDQGQPLSPQSDQVLAPVTTTDNR